MKKYLFLIGWWYFCEIPGNIRIQGESCLLIKIGRSPLVWVVDKEMIEILLKSNVTFNGKNTGINKESVALRNTKLQKLL